MPKKKITTLTHKQDKRTNIPTAELESVISSEDKSPIRVAIERRNPDLDPQLVWRGKDDRDELVVGAPPLYIQEKIHPKVLIDELVNSDEWLVNSGQAKGEKSAETVHQLNLFSDFNGLPEEARSTEFYQHEANWTNRMILGDSLQVMASLAEREGLRGKVQCIYLDPPYGIKFNSNFQWSTTSRDVKDGNTGHITREPEQVKAFRDTWRDGIHSYLTYLRDRLTAARDLLHDTGSIFVQIGDENVHRVRALMDEIFGDQNFFSQIQYRALTPLGSRGLSNNFDYIVWFAKDKSQAKYRNIQLERPMEDEPEFIFRDDDSGWYEKLKETPKSSDGIFKRSDLKSSGYTPTCVYDFEFQGRTVKSKGRKSWRTNKTGMLRLIKSNRLINLGTSTYFRQYFRDSPMKQMENTWTDTAAGFSDTKVYVVQTHDKIVTRCMLMTTDPGDLVIDPTCGSGTTATVAELWARRWITIDTSRVALALARSRIMGARYPYFLLVDSLDGLKKEAELARTDISKRVTNENIRHGLVTERVPRITLGLISNNLEIDIIWDQFQEKLRPLAADLRKEVGTVKGETSKDAFEEWEIPREADEKWSDKARTVHAAWWKLRIARQKEIDASIAAKADFEYLYDKPYEDKTKVRVAGPFTVESLSPHRTLAVDHDDELIDPLDKVAEKRLGYGHKASDFVSVMLENLRTAGVQQAHKEDRIEFTALTPWPGRFICAEGVYEVNSGESIVDSREVNSGKWIVDSKTRELVASDSSTTSHSPLSTSHSSLTTQRAAIFIGPEFGTVTRPDLVVAAREAAEAGFNVLITCAFSYDAHCNEFRKLGSLPILQARMNADLHMAEDLKNTGAGNLFVIFGEPDITVASEEWMVDSSGNWIAPYEIFKLVSRVDSLAKINGLSQEDLRSYAELSQRREIWDYLADATCGNVDSREYRGGSSPADNWRISTVSWHLARFAGGTRDLSRIGESLGNAGRNELQALVDRLRRDQQNASRSNEVAGSKKLKTSDNQLSTIHQSLSTIHSPLSTIHYSQTTIHGVDVFHPNSGEVRSDNADGIACWFIDTNYNEESFFVRHAYFLGANDPYQSLKRSLKAEINEEAWETLNSDTSRPFKKPSSGRIAVKVINHLGDEVMKVFRV